MSDRLAAGVLLAMILGGVVGMCDGAPRGRPCPENPSINPGLVCHNEGVR